MTKEQAIEWLKSLNYCDGEETQEVAQALDMAIKALEQQPSDDCVSRQAVIDMTGALNCFDCTEDYCDFVSELRKLPSVTPTIPTSDDCVDRNHIIATISHHHFDEDKDNFDLLVHNLCKEVKELPPVTPTQRWIPCSERLPEEIGTYLVTLEYKEHGKGITTLWYHGKQFGWDLRVADVVVAWSPLPQPYEE